MTNEVPSRSRSQVNVRQGTRDAIGRIAQTHRLSLTDAVSVAVEAFETLTPAQQREVIERRTQEADAA